MKKPYLKRAIAIFCAAFMMLPVFSSCSEGASEQSDELRSESSENEETAKVITIGEREFALNGEINSVSDEDGVYVFTKDYGKSAVSKIDANDMNFIDAVVIDGVVIEIDDKGSSAVIPEDGFIVRFRGIEDIGIKLGDIVKCDFLKIDNLPEKYLLVGGEAIEIGYENIIRTAEDTGWLYDSYWYTGNTMSNIYCTEIAVLDGKVVEINRSGDDISGINIPKGGFALAVGQGSTNERKLNRIKVGDSAEIVESDDLYSVNRFGFAGKDRSRPENGIVIYTDEKQQYTPVGEYLTEITVNDVGVVTEIIESSSGNTKIPENGFVISATGTAATKLARVTKLESEVFEAGTRSLYIVSTPITELARLKKERDLIIESYKLAVEKLSYIDFELVANIISGISENITIAESTLGLSDIAEIEYNGFDGEILCQAVKNLKKAVNLAKTELVPSITIQDRAVWITMGEHNYDGSLLLHYKTAEDVAHAVNYAKITGFNTLIIDNLAAGYAVYDSEVEGLVKLPELGELDLIEEFAKACKENELRLIVMVNSFSSGISGKEYPENHYMSIYKDKYLKTNKGRVEGPDGVITLDPADESVQAFNLAIISEIAKKYDIYGVQADYMRYPLPYYYQEYNYEDFGYNESTVAPFIKKYNRNPITMKITDPLWETWCAWRRDIISAYQKRFYQTVKEINPNLNVSFTCFADYRDRQIYTYQDVEKWAENGYADAIYPMIYGATTEYQLEYAEKNLPIAEYTDLVLGVGTYVKASHQSLSEQFIMPYELSIEGFSVFTLRYNAICGYNDMIVKALRNQAFPVDSDENILIEFGGKMLDDRFNSLGYATRFSENYQESEGKALTEIRNRITKAFEINTDFSDFVSELQSIKDEIESGKIVVSNAVKDALIHALDYVINLK